MDLCLEPRRIRRLRDGRPIAYKRLPRLGENDIEKLKKHLEEKPFWTTKEANCSVKERSAVELSEEQIRRMLRRT
jgi:transposase